jgi:ABC-type dipeptide/oligopeptide/nickel transport system permease subunit
MSAVSPPVEMPRRYTRRFKVHPALRRPLTVIGVLILVVWIFVAIFAPELAPYKPDALTDSLSAAPSSAHLFGTDQLGRDVLTRVMYGARISLPISALLVLISMTIGGILGSIAGFFGGFIDTLIMRLVDLVFAFPPIILALVVTAVLGPSLENAVFALVIVSWPTYARLVRGLVLSAGKAEYVQSSRLLGSSSFQTLIRDVLPNMIGPVVIYATIDFGNAILLLSGLSFLGLGAQPPAPEWGAMVSYGSQYFQDWWMSTFPGLAIFTSVLALNFLGDSLRDALDPRGAWNTGGRR